MSADTKHDDAPSPPEAAPDPSAAGDAEANPAGDAQAPAEPPADLEERVRALEQEKLRIAADFANYQKRINRDRAKWSQDAVRDLLAGMLPVLDNLEHAIASFEGELKEPQVYRQGVELVQNELLHMLGNHQLEPIRPEVGAPFDPDLHQAISLVPADDATEEVIAAVARTGYRLGEAVLRPAQVVVKKPQ